MPLPTQLNSSLLRGGFCAVWLFGIVIAFFEFLYAAMSDYGSPEQGYYAWHLVGALFVIAIAAGTHAYLIREANGKQKD
jgi:hypothetical protein